MDRSQGAAASAFSPAHAGTAVSKTAPPAGVGGPSAAAAAPRERRYDLDWLRVIAFLLLVPYHVGLVFVTWIWIVKNPQLTDGGLEIAMYFMAQWRLPLLFFVSGAGVWFALGRRGGGEFARERLRRLLIPLVLGILIVVPPQVYYERLSQGAGYGSFLQFLPDAYRGIYPAGNLSWHHLWFIAYLLVFSLAALPLLLWLRSARERSAFRRLLGLFAWPGALLLLAAPMALGEAVLRPNWPTANNLVADWANLVMYLQVFLLGFLLCASPELTEAMRRQRLGFLLLGALLSVALVVRWRMGYAPQGGYHDFDQMVWAFGSVLNLWCWVLALGGYARQYLNVRSRAIEWANEAVYPFYILHQPVLVGLAFHLAPWRMGIAPKFTILCIGTYGLTAVLYLLVRTNPLTRLAFGMKPAPARPAAEPLPVAAVA
jgi:glucans biosynthesis protein C